MGAPKDNKLMTCLNKLTYIMHTTCPILKTHHLCLLPLINSFSRVMTYFEI